MKILDDDCWVCDDCISEIANGDLSVVDYSYSGDEAEQRKQEIVDGELYACGYENGYWVAGDGYDEFSTSDCDCCGTSLAGARHRCSILGE